MCEHRVDPDDTEYTGSQDDDNGGRDTFSDATGSCDTAIHKTAESITEAHDPDPLHTCIDNSRFCSKQRQELPAKDQKQPTQDRAGNKCICNTDAVGFQHSFFVSGTPVLTDEACTCSIESKHDVIDQGVCICSGGISGNHDCIKRVDTGLYEQISNGKDTVLESCRDTQEQYGFAGLGMKADLSQ